MVILDNAKPEEVPLKDNVEVQEPKAKSFKDKLRIIKDNVTIEPVLAAYIVPGYLSRLASQNLYLDKACRVNLGFQDEVCDALIAKKSDYVEEEIAIQQLISGMEAWKSVLLQAIPSILILFIGAWSDRTGRRKICILLPIFGELLTIISNLLNAYFFKLPVQVMVFFEAFFPAITGGWVTTYMGTFSYISDISSAESRTFRVGVANLCLTAGGPIGSALGGILLTHIGYYGVFMTSAVLYVFSITYGYVYIKDPEMPSLEKSQKDEPTSLWSFLISFFNLKHVRETFRVVFKPGPNHRRMKLILVLASIAFVYGPSYGEYTIRYYFTRQRFNWDALKYSFWTTFYICMHAIGALISVSVFSKWLQWDDSVLGLMSSASKIAGGLVTAFATSGFFMYLSVVVETFNATSFTALRSISSKLVCNDEQGKMTSAFNLMEVLTSMCFGPIYSWLYNCTLRTDSGTVYYLSTALTIPPVIIFVWFYVQHNKVSPKEKEETKEMRKRSFSASVKRDDVLSSIDFADEKINL